MPAANYVLALAAFAVGTQTYVFTGLLSDLAADLGVSVATAGQLATAFAITSAAAAPLVANALSGIERRRVLVISLALIGFVNIGAALLPSFEALVAARVLLAVCSSVIIPLAGAIAACLVEPNRQGRALGLVLSGLTLAFILGVPLGSVIGGLFGWRATFVFAGLVSLSVVPAIARWVPRSQAAQRASIGNFGVLARPAVALGLVVSVVSFAASYPVFAFIGPLAEAGAGLGSGGIAALQSMAGFGSILGIVLGGRMADGRPFAQNTRRLFAGLVVSHAVFSLCFLAPQIGSLWIALPLGTALFCSSAVLFALGPVVEKVLVQAAPAQSALTLAMNTSMIYAGQGLGAVLGGLTIATQGYGALGALGALIAAPALAVALIVGARRCKALPR